MNLKITLIVAMLATAGIASAQTSSEKFDAKAEMQEQMSLIVNGLGLKTADIQELGLMMERNRKQKEVLLNQLDQIKQDLNTLELTEEKMIQSMLSAEDWAKYQKDIKPQLDVKRKERMNKLED